MRSLGIDYGKKRIGLALSDETGRFALPYQVVENDQRVLERIATICVKEQVGMVVVGESRQLSGTANPIMTDIKKFATALAEKITLPLVYELEYFSSAEAERDLGKNSQLDAQAAALILKSYIDRQK